MLELDVVTVEFYAIHEMSHKMYIMMPIMKLVQHLIGLAID